MSKKVWKIIGKDEEPPFYKDVLFQINEYGGMAVGHRCGPGMYTTDWWNKQNGQIFPVAWRYLPRRCTSIKEDKNE